MSIPIGKLERLPRAALSSYEFRVLVAIIVEAAKIDSDAAFVPLQDLAATTGIPAPHVSRSITKLEKRGIIERVNILGRRGYAYVEDAEWASLLGDEVGVITADIKKAFDEWMEYYPNPMRRADAEAMYAGLIKTGEASIEDLTRALAGYRRFEIARAKKFNRDPDWMRCMYAKTFLSGGTWREYVQFAGKKREPDL